MDAARQVDVTKARQRWQRKGSSSLSVIEIVGMDFVLSRIGIAIGDVQHLERSGVAGHDMGDRLR